MKLKKTGGVFSAATLPLGARHFSSGLNSSFTGAGLSFEEYVADCRNRIRKVRSATGGDNLEQAVDGNAPFALEPGVSASPGQKKRWRRGVLLTHGLSDSPYLMRHLAEFYRENGFRVMAVLLPGHGTQPGDLLDVRWQEWEKAVAYGTDKLAAEVEDVYLAGYSAGGTLSIYQSLHDPRIRGLFLFAPALQVTPRAAFARWHKIISWFIPRRKWLYIKPDINIYKYESITKNAAAQVFALIRALNAQLELHTLTIPVFAVASADDKTVKTNATMQFMARQPNPYNKLILYTTEAQNLVHDTSAERLEWVDSMVPEQKILGSAHTAIVVAPEDKYYGSNGEYANCVHYFPDEPDKYEACMNLRNECWQGEVTDKNLAVGTLRRLTYNPNFSALKVSMKRFIDCLPLQQ